MTKNEIELIKKALIAIDDHEMKRLESFPKVEMPNADEFDKKILALASSKKAFASRSPKRLIAALIAAAVLISAAISVYAFREPIKSFFIKKFGTHSTYSYESEIPAPIEEGVYEPTWLLANYSKTSYKETGAWVQTIWSDGVERIILSQRSLSDTGGSFDTETTSYEEITVGNQKYYYISKNGVHSLLWMNEKYSFTLWCTDSTKEEILKIATGMQITREFPTE